MSTQEKTKDIPYNEAFFKTSHNSYEKSVRKQLNMGVRGLEYDIHDDKIQQLGDFEVYHLQNNIDVLLGKDGNPDDYLFSNWLKVLQDWSNNLNKEHAPITLFVELKDSIIDSNNKPNELFGIKKLNSIITESLEPKTLFTFKNFRENKFQWPTVNELQGCVLIVLVSYWGGYWAASEGGFDSRVHYLRNCLEGKDDVCFVSWVQEDKGEKVSYLKENTHFWKCSLDYSTNNFAENNKSQRLTRADFDKILWGRHVKTYFNKNYEKGYRCNFPATDAWGTDKYDNAFPWSI
ncbi:MAG: hypothetical protein KGD58_10940 [Candidatus Lokiarchaeota archaeon]|nr:hypothetical protein [Candidatus Lokiarchaeota archaeon]